MKIPFFVGLGIGMVGAIHCVGMCGPFVFALPLRAYSPLQRSGYSLLYHIARVCVYLVLALVLGSFGNAVWRTGLFNIFSVSLGILILFYKLASVVLKKRIFIENKAYGIVSKNIAALLRNKNKTPLTFVFLGSLNGLLPCGLVYTALSATFAYESFQDTCLLMLGFGLATLPVLLLLRIVRIKIPKVIASKWSYIQSSILIVVATVLIFRGLNIKVPILERNVREVIHCH